MVADTIAARAVAVEAEAPPSRPGVRAAAASTSCRGLGNARLLELSSLRFKLSAGFGEAPWKLCVERHHVSVSSVSAVVGRTSAAAVRMASSPAAAAAVVSDLSRLSVLCSLVGSSPALSRSFTLMRGLWLWLSADHTTGASAANPSGPVDPITRTPAAAVAASIASACGLATTRRGLCGARGARSASVARCMAASGLLCRL